MRHVVQQTTMHTYVHMLPYPIFHGQSSRQLAGECYYIVLLVVTEWSMNGVERKGGTLHLLK